MTFDPISRRMTTNVAIVAVAWLTYALVFPLLHDLLDPHTGVTACSCQWWSLPGSAAPWAAL